MSVHSTLIREGGLSHLRSTRRGIALQPDKPAACFNRLSITGMLNEDYVLQWRQML